MKSPYLSKADEERLSSIRADLESKSDADLSAILTQPRSVANERVEIAKDILLYRRKAQEQTKIAQETSEADHRESRAYSLVESSFDTYLQTATTSGIGMDSAIGWYTSELGWYRDYVYRKGVFYLSVGVIATILFVVIAQGISNAFPSSRVYALLPVGFVIYGVRQVLLSFRARSRIESAVCKDMQRIGTPLASTKNPIFPRNQMHTKNSFRKTAIVVVAMLVTIITCTSIFFIETAFSDRDANKITGNAGMVSPSAASGGVTYFSGSIYNGSDRTVKSITILINASPKGNYTESWARRFEIDQTIAPLSAAPFKIPMTAYHGSIEWQIIEVRGPIKLF